MKNILYGIVSVIMGVGLLIGGFSSLSSSEVTCGDRVMHQGQQCDHVSRHGTTSTNDYATEKSNGRNSGIFLLILGPLMAVGGAVLAYKGLNERRNAQPQVAVAGPGPLPQRGPPPLPGYATAPAPGLGEATPAVSGNPYDFTRPTELACALDANIVLKRMMSTFVILAVVVALVVAAALGLAFPDTPAVWLGGSIAAAIGAAAAAYNAKRNHLQRNYTQLQRLILHPGGLRRFDPSVVIDIPWTGIRGITWRNCLPGSPSRVHTVNAFGGANAIIDRAHAVMSAGITGHGTISPLPGTSAGGLQVQDRQYGSQLAGGHPHDAPDCIIFPAEFEHDWTRGVVGAWLHHYRPDVGVPVAPPPTG